MKINCGSGRRRGSGGVRMAGLNCANECLREPEILPSTTRSAPCATAWRLRAAFGRLPSAVAVDDRTPCALEERPMSSIQSVMHENRVFEPRADWVPQANIKKADYDAMCARAARDFEGFWADLARETIAWHKPFTKVLDESNAPFFKWFEDGEMNVSYNCLD